MESDEDNLVEYLEEVEPFSMNAKCKIARVGDLFFAEAIKSCGFILLNKKQTPPMKTLKKQALREVIDFILIQKGFTLSEVQVYKKLNNMKARVKFKRLNNVKLNEGETLFFQLMTSDELKFTTTGSDEKYGSGDDGTSDAVDFELQTFQTTSTSQLTKPTKIGIGDKTLSDDEVEDALQPKSKHRKLSHPRDFQMPSVSVEGNFDKRDQYNHQIDPTSLDRPESEIIKIEKGGPFKEARSS